MAEPPSIAAAALAVILLNCTREAKEQPAGRIADNADSPRAVPGSAPVELRSPVVLVRSGGIAGYDDQILIHPNGRTELRRGAASVGAQVDAETLALLATALVNVAPLEIREAPRAGADQLMYEVEYEGHRLRFDAHTDDASLQPLRRLIERLLTR